MWRVFFLIPMFFGLTMMPTDVASASDGSVICLILDASGSMNAKLPSGVSRISAARAAVGKIVEGLPPGTVLGFRAYGHQSPREKHDCNDTTLLVPFGDIAAVKKDVLEQSSRLEARGYTPITKVIALAASELPTNPGRKAIILVSDGHETCEGDPCATAMALKKANADLVVHTIGFDVDLAARIQLRCLANATGGSYADVADTDQLVKAFFQATQAPVVEKIVVRKPLPGKLEIKNAELHGHEVIDATSGSVLGKISSLNSVLDLPAGLYNISFGASLWKSVEVEPGKTTTLNPAVIEVKRAASAGHEVRNTETGAVEGKVSNSRSSITLIPGVYDVSFGKIVWPFVKADGGASTILDPGTLEVKRANIKGHMVKTADGTHVGVVSATNSIMPLPPGAYTVEIGDRPIPFEITVGKQVVIEVTE